jgi:hypothetical protein
VTSLSCFVSRAASLRLPAGGRWRSPVTDLGLASLRSNPHHRTASWIHVNKDDLDASQYLAPPGKAGEADSALGSSSLRQRKEPSPARLPPFATETPEEKADAAKLGNKTAATPFRPPHGGLPSSAAGSAGWRWVALAFGLVALGLGLARYGLFAHRLHGIESAYADRDEHFLAPLLMRSSTFFVLPLN